MKFWETPNWIKVKTFYAKTNKVLSREEYLKMVGWKKYSEEEYQRYLAAQKASDLTDREIKEQGQTQLFDDDII